MRKPEGLGLSLARLFALYTKERHVKYPTYSSSKLSHFGIQGARAFLAALVNQSPRLAAVVTLHLVTISAVASSQTLSRRPLRNLKCSSGRVKHHRSTSEHTKHIFTVALALHKFVSNTILFTFVCNLHDWLCMTQTNSPLYFSPSSVMFDSSAPLSLADEPSGLEDSFMSATSSSRVDRLEKEVATLSKRLDQEEKARKRLQELLASSGVALPQDLVDSQA